MDVISQSNADAGFLDLSRMTDREIAQYGFNIDESMMGLPTDSPMTYRNEPGIWYRFWQLALRPIANEICAGLSALTPRGHKFIFDAHEMLLGGPHDRANVVAQIAQVSSIYKKEVVTPNELRDILGLPEMETFEPIKATANPIMNGIMNGDSDDEDGDDEESDDVDIEEETDEEDDDEEEKEDEDG